VRACVYACVSRARALLAPPVHVFLTRSILPNPSRCPLFPFLPPFGTLHHPILLPSPIFSGSCAPRNLFSCNRRAKAQERQGNPANYSQQAMQISKRRKPINFDGECHCCMDTIVRATSTRLLTARRDEVLVVLASSTTCKHDILFAKKASPTVRHKDFG
jgi:hypothetical protein